MTLTLLAPLSGIVVPLELVPDPAFAQRLVGDGVSIDPLSHRVLAPCDARVLQVHRAHHAVTLLAQGLELIIHVGLDTVMLGGDGFTALVKADDRVRAGDALLTFDAELVGRRARSLLTEVLVSNVDRIASIERRTGRVTAGRDVLMRIELAPERTAHVALSQDDAVRSDPILVTASGGLHARPAAMLTAAARHFSSDVRLTTGTREANARSLVSIMALEVSEGDAVTIVARGADAAAAVAAIGALLAAAPPNGAEGSAAAERPERPAPTPRLASADGVLRGVSASPGVAIGNVLQFRHDDAVIQERAPDPALERRALDGAIAEAHAQLEALRSRLVGGAHSAQADIFRAHQELLEDPELLQHAEFGLRGGASAAFAWKQAYAAQADRLLALENDVIAGRAADLRDVGRRVLHLLNGGGARGAAPQVPAGSILIAEDLAPSDAASIDRTRVLGFCTTSGSATSHAAILARGLGIPAIAGIDPRALELANGARVLLDADAGTLGIEPSAADEARAVERQGVHARRRASDLAVATKRAVTTDSFAIEVVANIGDVEEADRILEMGAEGVGLLRSEFLFLQRQSAPTEDEQAACYGAVARAVGPGRTLVIRTLDVGGDKPLAYLPIGVEANPFLGERGVRFTLNHPELMRTQLRAIFRAAKSASVCVMFPMISTMREWRAARAMVEDVRARLGVPAIPVGIMVETPAAAMLADQFAREADFLSLGTNDLTQYTLAMDRTNPTLAPHVDALHPAVLRLVARTVEGALAHGRWVGVCGALAGDLDAVPVLIGLGVTELSADLPIIPAVKARVRELSMAQCRLMAAEALEVEDGTAVRAVVARHGVSPSTGSAT